MSVWVDVSQRLEASTGSERNWESAKGGSIVCTANAAAHQGEWRCCAMAKMQENYAQTSRGEGRKGSARRGLS